MGNTMAVEKKNRPATASVVSVAITRKNSTKAGDEYRHKGYTAVATFACGSHERSVLEFPATVCEFGRSYD